VATDQQSALSRQTDAHFHVNSPRPAFDNRREANITISPRSDGGFLFKVRPLRGREFTMQLEDVAELVIWRSIKTESQGGGGRR
jgi:hypothetical protein